MKNFILYTLLFTAFITYCHFTKKEKAIVKVNTPCEYNITFESKAVNYVVNQFESEGINVCRTYDDEQIAFTDNKGNIYINPKYTGKFNSHEMLLVLYHEYSHIQLKHRKTDNELLNKLYKQCTSEYSVKYCEKSIFTNSEFLKLSRQEEYEADHNAYLILKKHGISSKACNLFTYFENFYDLDDSMSTHPNTLSRYTRCLDVLTK